MEEKGLQLIEWPSNSPDLNIVEHVWPRLKHQVRTTVMSEEKDDLREATTTAWRSCASSQEIENLYACMPKRIDACLKAKGRHTKYRKNQSVSQHLQINRG